MSSRKNTPFSHSAVFALILLLSGVFFRVIRVDLAPGVLPNFSPLMAAALCGALFLPGWLGLFVPVTALLLSDVLLNLHFGESPISRQLLWTLPCYLLAVTIGWFLRKRQERFWLVMGGTCIASLIFYLVTNTGSWLGLAAYQQNFAGWIQSMTIGLSGYPPTWTFFRNSLLGDLLFAALFLGVERMISELPENSKVTA